MNEDINTKLNVSMDTISTEIARLSNMSYMKIDLNHKHGNFYLSTINDCVTVMKTALDSISRTLHEYNLEKMEK